MMSRFNKNEKLSSKLDDILANQPEDYITAIIISPSKQRVLKYKNEISKDCSYRKGKDAQDCFEKKAKEIFHPVYKFFGDKNIECTMLYMDVKFGARLSKKFIKQLSYLPFVENIQYSNELSVF